MKSLYKFVLVFLYILLSSTSCVEVGVDGHKELKFKNNSKKVIFVAFSRNSIEYMKTNIDCTTLGRNIPPQGEYVYTSVNKSFEEDLRRNANLSRFWIFDAIVDHNNCDEDYIAEYMEKHLVKMYDLDEACIEQMNKDNWTIVYEGTEKGADGLEN